MTRPTPSPDAAPTALTTPLDEATVRSLTPGTAITLSGTIYTGRDRLHRHLYDGHPAPVPLHDGVIFHCGPVVVATDDGWRIVAAGPTTSMREEPYMARIIAEHGIRLIIGKGGMGAATVAACRRYGCVYVQAVGGAAASIAATISRVGRLWFAAEFGTTEAMWELTVANLPGVVAIDAHGRSLYDQVAADSKRQLATLLQRHEEEIA